MFANGNLCSLTRPADELCISEDTFSNALNRMHMALSHQERSALLLAFGFGDDGLLSAGALSKLVEEYKGKKTRIAGAVTRLREHLFRIASPSGAATPSTGRPAKRSIGAGTINFEAAWRSMDPVKSGRTLVVGKDQLRRVLYAGLGLSVLELREDEVSDVLAIMSQSSSGGGVLSVTSPTRATVRSAASSTRSSAAASPTAVAPDIQLSFLQFCEFLSPDELLADAATARLVELIKSSKQDPTSFFAKMDTDRSGVVGSAELRRCLNDAVAAVNDDLVKDTAPEAPAVNELDFFTNAVSDWNIFSYRGYWTVCMMS